MKFIAPDAKILLIDDVIPNLELAKSLLKPYKMQVDFCSSSLEAIELVKSQDYDIVFMDHMMPGMDGIEATVVIRAWERERQKDAAKAREQVPIIALTANIIPWMRDVYIEQGFNDFLSKPIEIPELYEILVRWLPEEKKLII